jgi:hypothetical protein
MRLLLQEYAFSDTVSNTENVTLFSDDYDVEMLETIALYILETIVLYIFVFAGFVLVYTIYHCVASSRN